MCYFFTMHNTKKLVIVAGAAGEIGSEYIRTISQDDQIETIAVIRNKELEDEFLNASIKQVRCHLDDPEQVEKTFSSINFELYHEVIFLHTIGVDKFDPRGFPKIKPMETIDPEVYSTNVNSFKYIFRFLLRELNSLNVKKSRKIKFKTAIIAGVANKYTPFVIESFCEAKFILRQYIQSSVNLYPDWVSGISINITSTVTKSALKVRPNADITYWLTPQEVVEQSFDRIINRTVGYNEFDIVKKSPKYVANYYENSLLLYKKWSRETGIY
jgi:NADP-dependent 3-hydroxy acid dehydrogenase YdfG